ncbi:MAG: hypothetical protein JWQ42_4794 [Edaphobacter sp.]|nr:hypothetical protein [Edaphobacter sp.]
MKTRTQLASLIVLTGIIISPAIAQSSRADIDKSIDTMLGDHVHSEVQHLVTDLQQAVAKHDAAAVAALVHYPIKINPGTRPFTIRTPQAFIARYDRIITPAIATVIQRQKYEDLFVNYKGAMFGNGEVWITSTCIDKACKQTDIKIGTIQSTANRKK